jgi:ketosteroid isomerase-like protein
VTRKAEREAFSAIDKFTYEIKDLKVDVFDRVAISTFGLDYDAKVGEDELSAKARGTLVFVKDGVNWKITHEHFSAFKANP